MADGITGLFEQDGKLVLTSAQEDGTTLEVAGVFTSERELVGIQTLVGSLG